MKLSNHSNSPVLMAKWLDGFIPNNQTIRQSNHQLN